MEKTGYKFDKTKMFYGYPHEIGKIKILIPTVGDIIENGELEFYNNVVNVFVSNPTTYRVSLWKSGVDWNKINEFELFLRLYQTIDNNLARFLFEGLDFSKLEPYKKTVEDKDQIILLDVENEIEINEQIYDEMIAYIRTVFNIFPKVEKIKGKMAKQDTIDEDIRNMEYKKKQKGDEETPFLLPLIESCSIHPGFKYTKEGLKSVGIYEFMRCVERIQVYEASTALLNGSYSGFVDTSKIDKDQMNFMRSL